MLRVSIVLLSLVLGAAAFGQATTTPAPGPGAAPGATRTLDPLEEAVRERVDTLRYSREHDVQGGRIVLANYVAQYYEQQQFHADWSDPARLDLLIAEIADLRSDGLNPGDYHVAVLQAFRDRLRGGRPLPARDQADLELLATDALMLATYHLYYGKVDPVKLSSQWNFPARPVPDGNPLERLAQAVDAGRIHEIFEGARPQHVWYQRGRKALEQYRAIAAAGGWSAIAPGPTLQPGMSDPRVPALRHRLEITHDLPAGGPATYPPSTLYDDALLGGVKAYQERNGLTPDGVVGPGTLASLNVPVSARIDQIRINLERGRWVLHEVQGDFVLVDVAGFHVSYFRHDEPIWTSRVVVGQQSRETPIFKAKITYVVFNPTWTIPPGILVKDKLPILRRDPGYLERNRILVLDSAGRAVNPYSIRWSSYGAGRLPPYQFQQQPGPDNALGLVKIMFPNPYLVYLHDTPAKSLFDKDQRTFSSGCIRVQKAFELAELVLNDPARWNQQSMQDVVATGKTLTVNLAKPVPVLLLYWTAQPRPDGQVEFRRDVYQRDAATLKALDSGFRVP